MNDAELPQLPENSWTPETPSTQDSPDSPILPVSVHQHNSFEDFVSSGLADETADATTLEALRSDHQKDPLMFIMNFNIQGVAPISMGVSEGQVYGHVGAHIQTLLDLKVIPCIPWWFNRIELPRAFGAFMAYSSSLLTQHQSNIMKLLDVAALRSGTPASAPLTSLVTSHEALRWELHRFYAEATSWMLVYGGA